MNNANVVYPTNPTGWPSHLMAYDPGRHRPRRFGRVTLFPYDHTNSRVRSYVAICAEQWYAGTVTVGRGEPHQVLPADGSRSVFVQDLADAATVLAAKGVR